MTRYRSLLLSLLLVLLLALPSLAAGPQVSLIPNEDGTFSLVEVPDASETEETAEPSESGVLTLTDDLLSSLTPVECPLEVLTLTTRNGHIFYVLLDYSKKEDNVFFLNQVDERDLLALLTPEERLEEEANQTCTCTEHCSEASVNEACPVCDKNYRNCGAATVTEPARTSAPLPAFPLLLIVGGLGLFAGFVWWKKKKNPYPPKRKLPEEDDD